MTVIVCTLVGIEGRFTFSFESPRALVRFLRRVNRPGRQWQGTRGARPVEHIHEIEIG